MRCGFHIDARYLNHRTPDGHPERPGRIHNLLSLLEISTQLEAVPFASDRGATRHELELVHTAAHIERIAGTAGLTHAGLDPDTHTSAESYETAILAAGAILDLVDAVVAGDLDNGFAAVRPPGHHAEADRAMGFCLFGNVALAARYLVEHHGLQRVAVVDWDVHHGNGTQAMLYDDPNILFISMHQYPFYPGSGAMDEVGEGDGRGFTVNVPLPAGCGDAEYLRAFDRIVVPVARAFAPQFVMVSAGFDAHRSDPLGGMGVTDAGFDAMTSMLLDVANESAGGKLVAALEGGYDVDALRSCVEVVLRRLSDGRIEAPSIENAHPAVEECIEQVLAIHREHWSL